MNRMVNTITFKVFSLKKKLEKPSRLWIWTKMVSINLKRIIIRNIGVITGEDLSYFLEIIGEKVT